MNKLLRDKLFQKPIDCKYCEMLSCGVLGATYTCVNEKSNYYFIYPVISCKDCKFYEKDKSTQQNERF